MKREESSGKQQLRDSPSCLGGAEAAKFGAAHRTATVVCRVARKRRASGCVVTGTSATGSEKTDIYVASAPLASPSVRGRSAPKLQPSAISGLPPPPTPPLHPPPSPSAPKSRQISPSPLAGK